VAAFFTSRKSKELEVSKHAMEVCEQIISEMGAELHDDLIQRLSVLRLSIDSLERSLSDCRESEKLVAGIKSEFHLVIQSVRKISKRLVTIDQSNGSFDEGVRVLCQNMERPGLGVIHFEANARGQNLSSKKETYLYRITQELIHNAFRHSAAWNVWVRLGFEDSMLTIEVEDDGTGFLKKSEFIALLEKKYNTLKMRSLVIGASIQYFSGSKGLLARVTCPT
jgi:signal transduction histidine kinase